MTELDYSKEDVVSFHTKLNALMEEANGMDWTPDKTIRMNSKNGPSSYSYVTIRKLQRNLAPACQKHGLNMMCSFHDLQMMGDALNKLLVVQMDVTLKDISTGYGETTTVFGGSSATNDKAVTFCQAYAVRVYLSTQFMVTYEEDEDSDTSTPMYSKTQVESDEVRSKVLDAGIKAPAPAPAPAPVVKKPVAPAPKAAPAVSVETGEQQVVEEKEPEAKRTIADLKAEKDAMEAESKGFRPSAPQQSVLNNIRDAWRVKLTRGSTTPVEFDQLEKDYAALSCNNDVSAFIKKYREKDKL